MDVEENFISISALICEPTRARMLWGLLDGRAYTATELSMSAGISPTSASNHLLKLLEADIVKVETQGRYRYYSFSKPEVAYVIESLANLANEKLAAREETIFATSGVRFCRTCYDHLAGYVGVTIVQAMQQKAIIKSTESAYTITPRGWNWFAQLEIEKTNFPDSRRPLTRQCLDWSERRPHLAGQLGAVFLEATLQHKWFRRIRFSRELTVTAKGREELFKSLGIVVQ